MSRLRALLASVLVVATVASAPAQASPAQTVPAQTVPAPTVPAHPVAVQTLPVPPATPGDSPERDGDLGRIRRGLARPSVLADSILDPDGDGATFRVSVTRKPFDLAAFWGEPDNLVGAYVRPSGGPWHHEYKQMVTPDMFKSFGNMGNSERLQLLATSGAFAAAMALVQTGVRAFRDVAAERARQRAREQVQRELEAFLRQHAIPLPPR